LVPRSRSRTPRPSRAPRPRPPVRSVPRFPPPVTHKQWLYDSIALSTQTANDSNCSGKSAAKVMKHVTFLPSTVPTAVPAANSHYTPHRAATRFLSIACGLHTGSSPQVPALPSKRPRRVPGARLSHRSPCLPQSQLGTPLARVNSSSAHAEHQDKWTSCWHSLNQRLQPLV
jgi:hypothetical protein